MRRIDPRDNVKVTEKTYLESLLIGVSVNITSTQQLVPISIKCMLRGNSQILKALEHANNCERDFVDMEPKVHRCRHIHFFVAWFDVLGVCLDEEVVVVLML